MRKVTFTNTNNLSISISTIEPYLLLEFDSEVGNTVYSNKGVGQDGATYQSNNLEPRSMTISFVVCGNSRNDLLRKKALINKAFNPKLGQGVLTYTDDGVERKIDCIIDALPYFKDKNISNSICLINATALDPYYKDLLAGKTEVAIWRGAFEFPLELLEEGIEMGYREPSLIVNVFNQGDVATGMKIQFKALATVTNPSLTNVDTGEFVKIDKALEGGEILTVNTGFQNKKVELFLNGVISNGFNYIDYESTFLQLDIGDNLFRYNADVGIDNLEVTIYYTSQYLGV